MNTGQPQLMTDEEAGSPEALVTELAASGELAIAARRAIATQEKLGIPVTYVDGDRVIKRFADGKQEVLGTVARSAYTLPPGVATIENK